MTIQDRRRFETGRNTGCYCETGTTFDQDFEFDDETGFECQGCPANVYYRRDEVGIMTASAGPSGLSPDPVTPPAPLAPSASGSGSGPSFRRPGDFDEAVVAGIDRDDHTIDVEVDGEGLGSVVRPPRRRHLRDRGRLMTASPRLARPLARIAAEYDEAPTVTAEASALWIGAGVWFRSRAEQLGRKWDVTRIEVGQPYATAEDQLRALDGGQFTVTAEHSDHPVWDVDTNVAFRTCHDIDGHWAASSDFTWAGEVRAYWAQWLTTPPIFRPVLFCESISQLASTLVNGTFPAQKVLLSAEVF